VIACPLLAQGVKIQFEPVGVDVVKARLERNPATNGEPRRGTPTRSSKKPDARAPLLADQESRRARDSRMSSARYRAPPAGSTIVVGAHIDFSDSGRGVIENWTGASLLPSLFEALRQSPRKHKFVFVGFSDRRKVGGL